LPDRTGGRRGQLAYIDAAHRVHARVEDAVRTSKDTGIGKSPSASFALSSAWLATDRDITRPPAWISAGHQPGHHTTAHPEVSVAVDGCLTRSAWLAGFGSGVSFYLLAGRWTQMS
jgi:hypothetical protein